MIRYGARMRVLIVGGGIAGLTLAALLRQRGADSVDVIEKASEYGGVGYVLALWPAGGNVVKEIGAFERMLEKSIPANAYMAFDANGEPIIDADFAGIDPRIDDARLIDRARLLTILRDAADIPVRFNTTIEDLIQDEVDVKVTFSDATTARYDCVIGADGVHSRVRELAFGRVPLRYSGLSGWAFWTKPAFSEIREYYGDGIFAGFYPGRDVLCCFAVAAAQSGTARTFPTIFEVRERFANMPHAVMDRFDAADPMQPLWRDDFYDVRAPRWGNGRVALLGDAAAAMLPTAGVGASIAMESAAVLAEELALSDSRLVATALKRYEMRRRKRVDRIQAQSRSLTWLVRVRGPMANVRDGLFRRMRPRTFVRSFSSVMSTSL